VRKGRNDVNERWCEGLDWIRVDEILEIDPELYVKLLCNLLGRLSATAKKRPEQKKYALLAAEMMRRIQKNMDDTQRDCIIEAIRITTENAKRDLERAMALLRPKLRIVKS
jgi:hypothetical protein